MALTVGGISGADAQAPSIEGTYRLVSRTLADGKVLTSPDIIGVWTYTNGYRTFNIIRRDAAGKVTSRSLVSTYKLAATEYSETQLFHIRTDQIGGREPAYDVADQTRTAPVTVEGGRILFKLPFESSIPVVFEGTKITVNAPGGVDVWEKVR